MTTFAFDYDGTWTADPEAFAAFAALLRRRGHRVLLVTARVSGHGEVRRACETHVDRIIYSGADYKRDWCEASGESVDVWIDDMPGMIGPDIPIIGGVDASDADRLREQLRDAEEAAVVYRDEAQTIARDRDVARRRHLYVSAIARYGGGDISDADLERVAVAEGWRYLVDHEGWRDDEGWYL